MSPFSGQIGSTVKPEYRTFFCEYQSKQITMSRFSREKYMYGNCRPISDFSFCSYTANA